MKVVICGSRFSAASIEQQLRASILVCNALDRLPDGAVVVTGGADGVDTWADTQARARPRLGLPLVMPADWKRLGRAAGPVRNRAMLDLLPDKVVAIWDGVSPGTRNMIAETRRRRIPIDVIEVA